MSDQGEIKCCEKEKPAGGSCRCGPGCNCTEPGGICKCGNCKRPTKACCAGTKDCCQKTETGKCEKADCSSCKK